MSTETLRPEPGSKLYWLTIFEAKHDVGVLIDRQATAQWPREHFRCGGCCGYATRRVADIDPETGAPQLDEDGNLYLSVPLCDTCTLEDAAPLVCDWGEEHKRARPLPVASEAA
jgi:hypothetical protein